MKILSIGNSFSCDAQRYLYKIASANGKELKCVNLYIGGCTLRQHYYNILDDAPKYKFEFNGENTGIEVSISQTLKSDKWDYVTLQQGSPESFDFDNYAPYIEKLADYVRLYLPKSKILIHKTWAYPDNRERLFNTGYQKTADMFSDIDLAYKKAFKLINADKIIPSGNAMLKAYTQNQDIVYRDMIHASFGFGRYLLGIVWYLTLFGTEGEFKHINEFDKPVSNEEKKLAYEIALETVTEN